MNGGGGLSLGESFPPRHPSVGGIADSEVF